MSNPNIIIVTATEDEDFEVVFDIRNEVFQEEQQVSEEDEVDGNDHVAFHYLALIGDEYVGTGRWRVSLGGKVRMERLAVLKDFRRQGIGRALMAEMLKSLPAGREIYLHAPVDSAPFYEKLGFLQRGEAFSEAGLLHVEMYLP